MLASVNDLGSSVETDNYFTEGNRARIIDTKLDSYHKIPRAPDRHTTVLFTHLHVCFSWWSPAHCALRVLITNESDDHNIMSDCSTSTSRAGIFIVAGDENEVS